MYERHVDPLLPSPLFLRRLGVHLLAASGLVGVSLALGTLGYHGLGKQAWIDAFLNSAMLLGGMGQIGDLPTNSGKLFAAFFSLYAGLVLIAVTTLLMAPVLHRVLHSVHLAEEDDTSARSTK